MFTDSLISFDEEADTWPVLPRAEEIVHYPILSSQAASTMDSHSKSIFQQFLIEEFENQMGKKQIDVVAVKRTQFNTLLEKAHNELRLQSFALASKSYLSVLQFIKGDPYPDELELTQETIYSIKCCFGYSALMSPERFISEELNDLLLDVIQQLNEKFRKRLFPMFLLVLLNFYNKKWLTTLTWCNEINTFVDEEKENEQCVKFFEELLPSSQEIRARLEHCEEVAFFSYGETLIRNTLLTSRFANYKDWADKMDEYIANKIMNVGTDVSELELHRIFHEDVFPIWCLTNKLEPNYYFSDRFASNCKECLNAKLREGIRTGNDELKNKLPENQVKLEKYVGQCAEFYQKLLNEPMEILNLKGNRNKMCNVATQTEKQKNGTKHIQTDIVKTKNVEIQVGTNSDILNAILEIKNKCLTMQSKKDDTICKLNKRIEELQEKINNDSATWRSAEQEFERNTAKLECKVQRQTERISSLEAKQREEKASNVKLQKLLVKQIENQYTLHKKQFKTYQKQANFMITFLKDMCMYLTPKSIPSDAICRQNIEIWENQLQTYKVGQEHLHRFYQEVRSDIIDSVVYVSWPELPDFPELEDNMVFGCFKSAIRNIIQTEEKLYFNAEYQSRFSQPRNFMPITNFQYPHNILRPQFPPQNNLLLGQGLLHNNVGASSVPLQYMPQIPQRPKRDISSQETVLTPNSACNAVKTSTEVNILTTPKKAQKSISKRMSKSTECLSKGAQMSCVQTETQKSPKSGACGPRKFVDKKEKEVILLDYVLDQCPGATEEEVALALLNLLEKNKGTLANIPQEKIVEDVRTVLRIKKQSVWVTPKSPHVNWHNDQTESECAICFEEFSAQEKYTLPCQHEYHKECIKKWLKTSSVCPICRIHSVIDEDFPPLH